MIFTAVGTLPVNPTTATRGSCSIEVVRVWSGPVTTVSTPGGSCAAIRCSDSVRASGQASGGLTTAVLPASSAGTTCEWARVTGQLKGTITSATPSGRRISTILTVSSSVTRGSSAAAKAAVRWTVGPMLPHSPVASRSTFPFSRVSSTARSARPACVAAAAALSSSCRSAKLRPLQDGPAACAASIAAHPSAGVPSGTVPTAVCG
jgi:hypothetical protein